MKEHEEKVEAQTEEQDKVQETKPVEEEEVVESIEAEAVEKNVEENSHKEPAGDKPLDDDALEQIENLKKHDAALLLITKTKHIVNDTEKQLDACKLLLEEDLKSYHDAKASLKENALEESEALLDEIGYVNSDKEETEEDTVVFEPKEEIPPFYVGEVSSGKFSSFLLSLIGGAVTFAGLTYVATEKAGVTLDVTKVPSYETATQVFGWYATLFGGKTDLFIGGGFVVLVTLFVMGLIYGLRVGSRAKRNLSFAKQQLEEAREYAKHKGNCKEEMDRVDAHMNDAIKLLKTYEVVLHEQNAKLKRILHIEGHKEDVMEYHDKSLQEMQYADSLVKAIKEFMATPMSEEGKLSGKSTMFLHSAKSKLQKFLDRYY